jgi:hypothetical protein
MTEDEAKTKACPYAKNFGASQQVADGPGPHCVASACMAWRHTHTETREFQHIDREGSVLKSRDHGYCGLAGAPR